MTKPSLKPDFKRRRAGLRQVDPQTAEIMKSVVCGQTDQRLSAQFGLSYNTWCKIRSGQPVRRSLAERLEHRVQKLIPPDPPCEFWAANANQVGADDFRHRNVDIEQARFEACVARELCGDVDF